MRGLPVRPSQRTVNRLLCALVLIGLFFGSAAAQNMREVYVNGVRLGDDEVRALEAYYQTYVPDGSYWYDPVSGLWGPEGGPAVSQIAPNLALGGSLQPDASGGGTGVYLNGRELHPLEVYFLEGLFGVVYPGRYWLNASGVGGFEGGPPAFDLGAAAAQAGGGGGGGYTYRGAGGLMGGDGECFYYNDPETGASYLAPGC